MIDIAVLHGHINQVVHDLALSEVVNNSWKILQDNRVKSTFIGAGRKADLDSLEHWLLDVAAGEQRGADIGSRYARLVKSGFTVSKLALNLSTALVQVTGITQSMVVVGKKDFLLGLQDVLRRPLKGANSAANEAIARSAFMQERETTFNKDIYDVLGDTRTGPTQGRVSQFTREVMAPVGFWLMQKTQFYLVDLPTWYAGYRKGLAQTGDEAQAIAFADRTVARAQASGNFSDRTAIERGTAFNARQSDIVRLFTTLGSYMFAKFNVAYERTAQTDFLDPMEVLSWTADMAMLFVIEAILYNGIKGTLPDLWGDDNDDSEGWLEFLAKETAFSIASTLPFIRDGSGAIQGFGGGGAYGSIMETFARPFGQIKQGEIDPALVKSMVNVGGIFFHIPSAQANRVIDAGWRQLEGDDVAPIEYLMGRR